LNHTTINTFIRIMVGKLNI